MRAAAPLYYAPPMPDASSPSDAAARRLSKAGEKLHLADYTRHIFLCVGGDCAPTDEQEAAWSFLKRRLKELELVDVDGAIFRSKAACLRVCTEGPIAVVYPEGTWYRACNADNLERIIQEHLVGGRPVDELAFARNGMFDAPDVP